MRLTELGLEPTEPGCLPRALSLMQVCQLGGFPHADWQARDTLILTIILNQSNLQFET